MGKNKTVSGLKKQLAAAIAMVLVAAISLGTSTYAWFVNNTKVTADNVKVTAKAANTLLISHDNDNKWGTTAKFKVDSVTDFVPVSTINAVKFYKDKEWATETGTTQNGVFTAVKFVDAADTDYYTDTFKIKASQDCGLYLDSDTKFTLDTGVTSNVLKTMRLALVVDGNTYFYQIDANPIADTDSTYNTTLVSLYADGVKKAISDTDASAEITATNLSSGSVIALSAGTVTAPTDNTTLVAKDDTKKLCDLTANTEKEVKVYIWMEGCDYDCNSTVVKDITEKAVTCVLGFCAGQN